MAVEENSNVTVDNVEANGNNEMQKPSSGASEGIVAEEEKSHAANDYTKEANPENEKQTSNGYGGRDVEVGNAIVPENETSNSTLNAIGSDDPENENPTSKEGKSEIENEEKQEDLPPKKDDASSEFPTVLASSSYREASDYLYNLKEFEKKALYDLRAKVQEAILENRLIKDTKVQTVGKENPATIEDKERETFGKTDEVLKLKIGNVKLWGVPFFASKADNQTDTILLMFLRASEFIVSDAFDMFRNILKWRKDKNIDSILSEDFGSEFDSISYMNGRDRESHPICYNVVGALGDQELYDKALGTPEKRERLVRWRIQLMEKAVRELDFRPGGVTSLLQVTDLKNMPAPSRKDFRIATRETVETLQNNYPEFVAKNVFINVPFWYYAFSALLSPFISQRTKNKFVFARPNKVTETLLKYIPAERLPLQYGGLWRENDAEFSTDDATMEISIKPGSVANIEIPAPEAGIKIVWELFVLGWDVNYKEEFIPTSEGSYSVIVQRSRKIGAQEGPIRNSFRNSETGKLVLTVENGLFKKKNLVYRYKTKN